jgi:hypothetical protein
VAERIDARVATVSLRRPPPLQRVLDVRRDGGGRVALYDGDVLVADGEPAELSLDVPAPVDVETARAARAGNPWVDSHPFPTCFGCGTRRNRAEAIATVLGPVEGREGLMADTWTPQAEFADSSARVTALFVWAALDCPTGAGAIDPETGPHVLARLTADPRIGPVRAGEEHVVIAWLVGREGRKSRGGAAIYTADGELCAMSEGLWIRLRDPSSHGARV